MEICLSYSLFLTIFDVPSANIYIDVPEKICNLNCSFCIGKQMTSFLNFIQNQFHIIPKDTEEALSFSFKNWNNLPNFLEICREHKIKHINITSLNTDPAKYEHLGELVDFLKCNGFEVGISTNAVAWQKDIFSKFNGLVSLSIQSINSETNKKIVGNVETPNWSKIITESGSNIRIVTVVTSKNINEIVNNIIYFGQFDNIQYIQIRSSCNDIMEHPYFEKLLKDVNAKYRKIEIDNFPYPVFEIQGKMVVFWDTTNSNRQSLNFLTNEGVIISNNIRLKYPNIVYINDFQDDFQTVSKFIKANW